MLVGHLKNKEKTMMHYNNVVVTLCDPNRNSFREYESSRQDNGRKGKVYIPFDSEYQFYLKTTQSNRVKFDIFVDGSLITDQGFVVDGHSCVYLERFLNSDKKFRFVRASHEGVADPTSIENGVIKVIAHKEKSVFTTLFRSPPLSGQHRRWDDHLPYVKYTWHDQGPGTGQYGGIYDPSSYSSYSSYSSIGSFGSGGTITSASSDVNANANANTVEPGATIEGSFSNQQFTSTYWNGDDGHPIVFTFHAVGTEPQTDPVYERKMKEFLKLKQELRL